jgi:hypothetical protein
LGYATRRDVGFGKAGADLPRKEQMVLLLYFSTGELPRYVSSISTIFKWILTFSAGVSSHVNGTAIF